ncbi:MAG: DegV family protein [Coriobacteriaceae bacterium]|nr:DegV family protein [Coriobacteriaceae bacterium]
MPVRIITDSGSEFKSSDHPSLEVLPLVVTFGEDTFYEGVDLSYERFYEMLVERSEHPTTGQVTPFVFSQALDRAREAGDDVVIITMSSGLSGTYQSACIAAEGARAAGSNTVRVVDSLNMTLGERIVVQYALQLVDAGKNADEIADELDRVTGRVHIFGLIDTLEYLKRGGRISAAAGAVGELLSIKPVITVTNGEVVVLGKARGAKNGRGLLHREIEKAGGIDYDMPAALGYSGNTDKLLRKYLNDYRDLWESSVDEDELPISQVGAAIGVHVGPGGIAVAFFGVA